MIRVLQYILKELELDEMIFFRNFIFLTFFLFYEILRKLPEHTHRFGVMMRLEPVMQEV